MVLRFFIICTAISVCVRAHPSRLKILPGLAFYRTDDGHDDSDNSLMDKDKDLLKSMWNIVDKIDTKNRPNPTSFSHSRGGREDTSSNGASPLSINTASPQYHPPSDSTPSQSSAQTAIGASSNTPHGPGSKLPSLGTPITTINVYSTYPGANMKGEAPYTATTYHHSIPNYHGNNFGGTPYSATPEIRSRNRDNRYNQNVIPNSVPNFDGPKSQRNPFDSYMPPGNNPMPFDQPSGPSQESMISQSQYDSLMNQNGNMGGPFDGPMDNTDSMSRSMFDTSAGQGDGLGQDYGGGIGMENPAGSAPLQFMIPQMGNAPMKSLEDMMQENYQNMNSDPLRSHMHY